MGINLTYSTRTVRRYPRYNVRLNSVRLLAIQISRGIIFHTFGLDILMTLNHNSPRLEGLVWNHRVYRALFEITAFRGPCLKSVWERRLWPIFLEHFNHQTSWKVFSSLQSSIPNNRIFSWWIATELFFR